MKNLFIPNLKAIFYGSSKNRTLFPKKLLFLSPRHTKKANRKFCRRREKQIVSIDKFFYPFFILQQFHIKVLWYEISNHKRIAAILGEKMEKKGSSFFLIWKFHQQTLCYNSQLNCKWVSSSNYLLHAFL